MRRIEARYEKGLLKPETPLPLTPGERVALIVVRHPDPKRWNLERLAKSGAEDRTLAEQGLASWADLTDKELAELELATDEALGRIEPGSSEQS